MSEKLLYLTDLDGVLLRPPDHAVIHPDNMEFFHRVRKLGHYAGIFTDRKPGELEGIISDYPKQFKVFNVFMHAESSPHSKSSPLYYDDMERIVCQAGLLVARQNFRLFEDSVENYLAAQNAGLNCTLVRNLRNSRQIDTRGLDAEAVDSLDQVTIPTPHP